MAQGKACHQCGAAVQDGWNVCPLCTAPLANADAAPESGQAADRPIVAKQSSAPPPKRMKPGSVPPIVMQPPPPDAMLEDLPEQVGGEARRDLLVVGILLLALSLMALGGFVVLGLGSEVGENVALGVVGGLILLVIVGVGLVTAGASRQPVKGFFRGVAGAVGTIAAFAVLSVVAAVVMFVAVVIFLLAACFSMINPSRRSAAPAIERAPAVAVVAFRSAKGADRSSPRCATESSANSKPLRRMLSPRVKSLGSARSFRGAKGDHGASNGGRL